MAILPSGTFEIVQKECSFTRIGCIVRSAINDVPAFFPPLGVASVARSLQHDHKGRCR